MTRCCPLSHVTSVIDAEWFWKNARLRRSRRGKKEKKGNMREENRSGERCEDENKGQLFSPGAWCALMERSAVQISCLA